MYRSRNPSYLRFLRTSAERDADPGSVAVRANCIELFPFNFVDGECFHLRSNVNIDYLLDESRLELIKYDYHEKYE